MNRVNTSTADKVWEDFLSGKERLLWLARAVLPWLPSAPRCKLCFAPFRGIGGRVMKLFGKGPWERNPNVCGLCARGLRKLGPGGAEVELTLLFADIRGSTALADSMTPRAYRQLVNRFFQTATEVFVDSDAIIDQLVGDEVIGLYLPGFAGPHHAARAIAAGRTLIRATGHDGSHLPWVPIGIGIHTGIALVGSVGSPQSFIDFTATGDAMNVCARLAAAAGKGEVLVSESAQRQAHMPSEGVETRIIPLKGKREPLQVFVLRGDVEEAAHPSQ